MADEKLPDAVEDALDELIDQVIDSYQNGLLNKALRLHQRVEVAARGGARLAIHRYAREREAAALERCLKIADQHADINAHGDANDALRISGAIRALIHKEPANG